MANLSAYRKRASIPKRVELLEQALFDLGFLTEDMLGVSQRLSSVESTASNVATRVGTLEAKPDPVIPKPATTTPLQVAPSSAKGSSIEFALADHTHAARVQRKIVTLDANGYSTWTFAKPFASMPSLQYMVFQSSGAPIIVEGQTWIMDGTNFVGVTIRGYRSQNLPQQQQMGIGTLLSGLLNGVNVIASTLTGFNVFGGGSLNGVSVHMSAGDQM